MKKEPMPSAKERLKKGIAVLILTFTLIAPIFGAFGAEPASNEIREEIIDLNSDVAKKKRQAAELEQKADQYKDVIAQKKLESASIEDQMALLDNNIGKKQLDIDIANDELRALALEIKALDVTIGEQEKQAAKERELLGTLSRKLYRAQFKKSTFEVLMSYSSFSEFFDAMQSVVELQTGVNKSLSRLKEVLGQLAGERKTRSEKELAVAAQKRSLEIAKAEIQDERELKNSLLIETKSSELEYRYLLAELQQEQNQADSEIEYLEKVLRQKKDIAQKLESQQTVLSWPVAPTRGISTNFHDPEYPFRNVFEHPGLDIRAGQGTPVRASAAGIVARAKNAGYGYSYVMLIHNNNMSTVYGHLSRITAKEDTFLERGEIIGYSGGMPGTPGAGRLTTGPHLHFETRFKGFPVDPFQYLTAF